MTLTIVCTCYNSEKFKNNITIPDLIEKAKFEDQEYEKAYFVVGLRFSTENILQ